MRLRDNYYVPQRILDAIHRYVEHGIPPGHFLTAVITNNLIDAIYRADDECLENLPAIVAYFYNETPGMCWGSPEYMRTWINYIKEKKARKCSNTKL